MRFEGYRSIYWMLCQLHCLQIRTWICQSFFQCRPSHKQHQDPDPKTQWPRQQTPVSGGRKEKRIWKKQKQKRQYNFYIIIFCFRQKTPQQERPGTYRCGMALQVTINLPQVEKIRLFNKACLCPGSIQDWGSMALDTGGIGDHFSAFCNMARCRRVG